MTLKSPLHSLSPILLCLAFHCGGDDVGSETGADQTYDLSIELNGYGMTHNGDTVYFNLVEKDDTVSIAKANFDVISGGGGGDGGAGGGGGTSKDEDIMLSGVLKQGQAYQLYLFDDLDGNATCEDTDHSWVIEIAAVTEDVDLIHSHSELFGQDCTNQSS